MQNDKHLVKHTCEAREKLGGPGDIFAALFFFFPTFVPPEAAFVADDFRFLRLLGGL